MAQGYLIEWLDILVSITLNPEKSDVRTITIKQAEILVQKIREETATVQTGLKRQVFALSREKEIRLFVQNYHTTLTILSNQVSKRQNNNLFQRKDLQQVMNSLHSCFQELISFIEVWFAHYLDLEKKPKIEPDKIKGREKILCNLSSDQAALVLRAADELQILVSKSMRNVFKTITPHLSTPHKKDLSYDAMRVNAYKAEENDKEIAIAQLQSIIEKIKGY